uniref:Interferon a3-like n=1 Tax=Acanthochromis polyacanthus TaxID=80966 RepID=A0A3Q1GJN3_9TELE
VTNINVCVDAALLLLLLLQDEDKLAFVVQVLQEAAALFEEDHSSASWEESTAENFLNLLNKQADELSSCVSLTNATEKQASLNKPCLLGHSAEAWELIRTETELHLMRVHQLASSVSSSD